MDETKIFPRIKKKFSSFLMSEEGSISGHTAFTLSTFIGASAVSLALSASEVSAWHCDTHVSRALHGSHGSHGSHTSHCSHSNTHASHGSHGNGSGCPYVAVLAGTRFIPENNLIPDSELPEKRGREVDDLYILESKLVPKKGKYMLQLQEFENEVSEFGKVELIKVVHPSDSALAIEEGRLVLLSDEFIFADLIMDDGKKDYTKMLSGIDDSSFFQADKGKELNAVFSCPEGLKDTRIVIRSGIRGNHHHIYGPGELASMGISQHKAGFMDMASAKKVLASAAAAVSIGAVAIMASMTKSLAYTITLDSGGRTIELPHVHPREEFSWNSTIIADNVAGSSKDLRLKIRWTNTHKLSFIGLKKKYSHQKMELRPLKLESALFNDRDTLGLEDDRFREKAVLAPGNFITLSFADDGYKAGTGKMESFVLKTKGRYVSI